MWKKVYFTCVRLITGAEYRLFFCISSCSKENELHALWVLNLHGWWLWKRKKSLVCKLDSSLTPSLTKVPQNEMRRANQNKKKYFLETKLSSREHGEIMSWMMAHNRRRRWQNFKKITDEAIAETVFFETLSSPEPNLRAIIETWSR